MREHELTWTWLLSTVVAMSIIVSTAMERIEVGSANGLMVFASVISVFVLASNLFSLKNRKR